MLGLMMQTPLLITGIMRHAERVNSRTEVVSVTAENPRHRCTLGDVFRRARKLANALTRAGVQPGDRIATLAWNDYRHLELYYAVSCIGAILHTLNPRLYPEQITYIINHAGDRMLFADLTLMPLVEKLKPSLKTVERIVVLGNDSYEAFIANEPDTFDWPDLDERTASALCYTSGTTGNPKGVLFDHRSTVLHSYGSALVDTMGFGRRDTALAVVPMFHANAWGLPYSAPMVGAKLVFPGPKMGDGATLAALIDEEQVTFAAGVPTVWQQLLAYTREHNIVLESLEKVLVGGSACPLSIMNEFRDRHDVWTIHAWGMTEMSPLGTTNSQPADWEQMSETAKDAHRSRPGRPVFGVEMKVENDAGQELPWDGKSSGLLKVRGPWVCSDYFRLGEKSVAHDEDGWFATGDVGNLSEDGTLQITDRSKDVIKSGGEWISSIDLECVAAGHPKLLQAAVIGVPHPKWDERPLLIAVPRPGESPTREELLAWLVGRVAKWWIPDDVVFVEKIPLTATGKISKVELRLQFKDYRFGAGSQVRS
ncbi:MAG: long-chain-fatty-acid--CoA ligase [Gammaproteobacteria bacterium]|nr:long-chain-fatty-acid--CoA ligase [Gammaproteobacteria bacterium]